MEHVLVVVVWDTVAVNPSAVTLIVGPTTPLVVAYCRPPAPITVVYFTESAKNASSAVIRLRRSDFIDARYAFSFVFANFGIAIAARIPMITTTIRSSMRVKPLRVVLRICVLSECLRGSTFAFTLQTQCSRLRSRQRADHLEQPHVHPSPTTSCANGVLRRTACEGECFARSLAVCHGVRRLPTWRDCALLRALRRQVPDDACAAVRTRCDFSP